MAFSLVFSLDFWKVLRDQDAYLSGWTDEQLEAYDKKTGFIGSDGHVDCYVQPTWAEFFEQCSQ